MKTLITAIACVLTPLSLLSQATIAPFEPVPQISVSGRGEVKISPDRASIQISVQTRAKTAGAAGAENASLQKAVLDALRRLGLTNDQLSTTNYTVSPEYKYEPNRNPVIVGYVVTNTIVADVRDLTKVGPVIDGALGAGANLISSLQFYASNTQPARQTAITSAVQQARAEAEIAARAAGGTLGNLIELNIGSSYSPPPRPMYMAKAASAEAADTQINPGQETVTVEVTTRWRFLPGR